MKKPKLYAVMIYFNEEEYLKKNIWALDFVDGIILVDGAFAGFDKEANEKEYHWSTDNSDLWIESFIETHPDIRIHWTQCGSNYMVHQEKKGWKNEIVKRDYSIQQVPDGDFFFIVDVDEKVICHPEILRAELYSPYLKEEELCRNIVIIHHPNDCGWFFFPRIYKKVPDMHYKASHSNVFVGDNPISWNPPYNSYRGFKSLIIIHESAFYEKKERKISKWNYIHRRTKEEDVKQWKRDKLIQDVTPDRKSVIDKLLQAKRNTGVQFILHNEEEE